MKKKLVKLFNKVKCFFGNHDTNLFGSCRNCRKWLAEWDYENDEVVGI